MDAIKTRTGKPNAKNVFQESTMTKKQEPVKTAANNVIQVNLFLVRGIRNATSVPKENLRREQAILNVQTVHQENIRTLQGCQNANVVT